MRERTDRVRKAVRRVGGMDRFLLAAGVRCPARGQAVMMPPCKVNGEDCPRRTVGCQGRCAAYLAYRAERDELLEQRYRDKTADNVLSDGRMRARANYQRRRKR